MSISRFVQFAILILAFISVDVTVSAATATPTFSVPAGTYQTTQTVAIRDATAGVSIYYTTNGLAPTTSSALYTAPVVLPMTTKLRAVAAASDGTLSATATNMYTITPAATPTFDVPAGTYQTTQTVTISNVTSGSTIYYTTNGLAPTTASAVYSGPVIVANSLTLRAVAALLNGPASAPATNFYTITPAATPAFSLPAGSYQGSQTVTISDATAGALLYYTTNGLAPTTSSARYTAPISVGSSIKLRAVAALPNGPTSAPATNVYTITPVASTPTFSVPAGTYQSIQTVGISTTTSGATLYYTTNGSVPTASSTRYIAPVTIGSSTTLRAVAVVSNGASSATATNVYTIAAPAIPTFSVPAGSYQTTQTVAISFAVSGASIRYTINGVAPTASSTMYSVPITVSNSMPLRAVAVLSNGTMTGTATSVYTITPAAVPTFSVPAGTYQTSQTVTISDATPGAAIYYTTSGIAPTPSSTLYTAPITVSNTMSLRAIAVYPNGPASANATNVYTIAAAATPTFSPVAGAYTGTQTVMINDATQGAILYYTTNGLAPTTSSARYTTPVSIGSSMKLRAVAVYPNGPISGTATGVYTITQSPTPIKTPNSSASFFGMDINYLGKTTPWPNMPVSSIRLWNTGTVWGILNQASGVYNWSNLDQKISIARANDAEVLYTFGGVPPWAIPMNITVQSATRAGGVVTVTTAGPHGLYFNPTQSAISQTKITLAGISDGSFNGSFYLTGTATANTFTYAQAGADGSSSLGQASVVCSGAYAPLACAEAPANLSDWDQYVTQLINHLGPGTVQYWELWNEPDLSGFWKGDPGLLVAMAQDARRIIKSVDPAAVILSPGMTGNYETEAECVGYPSYCGSVWLDNWLSLGGNKTIDAVAFHGYPVIGVAPEQIQGAVNLIQSTMAQNGVGNLPLWDTESSWGTSTAISGQSDQAAWLVRHLLLEESMGVQRQMWYSYDTPVGGYGSLWSSSTGLNAAGTAYTQVEKWLTGTTLTQPCAALSSDSTTFVCGYTRPNGYVGQAIWNTAGSKSVAVPAQFTQYHDVTGAVLSVGDGTVQISTSPILLENTSAF